MTDVFNSRFSILTTVRDVLAGLCPSLPVFVNTVKRSHEEQAMLDASRYLVLDIQHGEIRYDQPVDVSLGLYVNPSLDPTTLWTQRFPYQLSQALLQYRSNADDTMVALYDYDRMVGQDAITAFVQDGTIPDTLLAALDAPAREVTHNGHPIGLKALPSPSAPVFEFKTVPYRAIWHVEFTYFHPGHIVGSNH